MSRFLIIVGAVYLIQAAVLLLPGALIIQSHEGDALHAIAGALLVATGQIPHVDFMTPLGIGAFAPVALFLALGYSAATSFVLAELLVALLLMPLLVWVAYSRLAGGWRAFMVVTVMLLATAVTAGGVDRHLEISMYYNRWAWCVAIIVCLQILLPPHGGRGAGWPDAVCLGVGLALLALTKVTYFAGLAPACAVYFFLGRDWRGVLLTVAGAVACVAVVTVWVGGPAYWLKYVENLHFVSQSDVRPHPRDAEQFLQQFDTFFLISILIFSILRLWNTGSVRAAVCLLFLAPGLLYIAFQNFGNDPIWLLPLALVMLTLAPAAGRNGSADDRTSFQVIAIICLAGFAPVALNLFTSSLRMALADRRNLYEVPLARADSSGIFLPATGFLVLDSTDRISTELLPPGWESRRSELEKVREDEHTKDQPLSFQGREIPFCRSDRSFFWTHVARELEALPDVRGKPVMLADLGDLLWLFGDIRKTPGSAIWYYGGEYGLEFLNYLVVPKCAVAAGSRNALLTEIQNRQIELALIRETELYFLYQRVR